MPRPTLTPLAVKPMLAGCLATAALLLPLAMVARAQEFRASIIGQVVDPTGAAVPGAEMTAIQHGTNQVYAAKSDRQGVYAIDLIPPGEFTITVEAQRSSKKIYSSVTLDASQKLNLNVRLSLGPVEQQVTVTESPGLLDTATASGGGVVDQTRVENMPSNGRRILDDVVFLPGAFVTGTNDFNSTPRAGAVTVSINGVPTSGNSYFVNGAPIGTTGNADFVPSQDSIQELQVSIDSYDSAVGPGAGGVFNSVLKAGTNTFHGTLYEYYGNAVLNANFWSSKVLGEPRPVNTRSTYGTTLGGPILKNKTFFFFSYEGFFQHEPSNSTYSVPTVAMRSGNFAGSGYTVYDPSTVACVNSTASGCSQYSRAPFPNDAIPQSSISPIGQAILNVYPLPNLPGSISNFVALKNSSYGYNQYIGRVDHSFSADTRLYGLFGLEQNSFTGNNTVPGPGTDIEHQSGQVAHGVLDFTKVISATLVGDVKLSFARSTWPFTTYGTTIQQNYQVPGLTMPFIPTTTHQNIAPTVAVTGYTGLFGNTANGTVSNYWYFSPGLAQVKGRHTLHYGFNFMDIQSGASGIPGSPNGAFTFGGGWTQQDPLKTAPGSGSALADLLLGYPVSGSVQWNTNDFISYHYYAGYVQDDFKLRSNITLNLGLRWEATTSPTERHNGINGPFCFTCTNPYDAQINHALYPTLPNPLTGGLTFAGVGTPRTPYNTELNNWQPRAGIAWAVTPKTVFRAGFGIFYSEASLGTTTTGYSQTTSYIDSLNGSVNPTNYFRSGIPYPNGVLAPAGSSGGLATNAGNAISYYGAAGYIPWTDHWSVGVQRELPQQILLDIEYVGSHTHPINVSQPWDVISSAEQAACFKNAAICNTNVANPFYGVLPAASTLGAPATVPAWELTRPYPLFNGITQSNDPLGYSVYNALQVRFERKIKNLNFVGTYSYANTMSADSYLNAGNFRDSQLWYGPDPTLDVRQIFTVNVVWPLPVGQGGKYLRSAKGWLGAILNNWVMDNSLSYRTGLPLSVPSANLSGAAGCTSYLPAGGQTAAHWFNNNESCYQTISQWQTRTTPLFISYLTNPAYWEWNAALQKSFTLPWREIAATLRAECINCDNSASADVSNPNTTLSNVPTFEEPYGPTGFGTITGLGVTPRQIIVSFRISF